MSNAQFKIDIDWRYSALSTWTMDIYQTQHFHRYNLEEKWNPITKYLLKNGSTTFTIFSLSTLYLGDRWIQSQHNKKMWYIITFAVESLAVLNNRKLGCPGFPIIVFDVSF
jgi:hypothetical protein